MKLNKRFYLFLYVFGFFVIGIKGAEVSANTGDTPSPLEELFFEIGYQSVDEALEEFEQHFKEELKLPTRLPPISFTHQFGRFNNLDGEINDMFEVSFINEQLVDHHFKIDVRLLKHKIPFEQYESKIFKLKNGKNANYIENQIRGFNLLIFETDHWQYVFSIDQDVSNEVTPEILMQIANSIDFK